MKFLVIISACLAVSSGSILPIGGDYGEYRGYSGPLADSLPAGAAGLVVHLNGAVTPAETPSVASARAEHLAARGALYEVAAPGPVYAEAPVIAAAPALGPVAEIEYTGYSGPLADSVPAGAAGLVVHLNGAVTPAETPSVAAARADHLAARGALYQVAAPGPVYAGAPVIAAAPALGPVAEIRYIGYTGPLADSVPAGAAGLVVHLNGAVTPAETPSVAAARADHLASRSAAYEVAAPVLASGAGYGIPAVAAPAVAAVGPVSAHAYAAGVIPVGAGSPTGALVTFANGAVVPADEPAVVAARAEHLRAFGGTLGW